MKLFLPWIAKINSCKIDLRKVFRIAEAPSRGPRKIRNEENWRIVRGFNREMCETRISSCLKLVQLYSCKNNTLIFEKLSAKI